MPVPAVPRARLVVRQPQLGLGGLERILDRPAPAFRPPQSRDRGAGWTPGREERQILIAEGASDQQTARPQAGEVFVVFLRLEIRQLHISPVVQARPLGAVSRRQAPPGLWGKCLGTRLGRA